MREILFRGKRKDIGEWINGNLAAYDLISPDYPTDTSNATGEYYGETPYVGFVEIDPETIGQFTGRVDKNRKKVFEGDILHVTVDGQDWGVGVVQWCDHDQCFSLFTFPDSNHRLIDFGDLGLPEYYEIIGNMYDDPHLLSAGGEINA